MDTKVSRAGAFVPIFTDRRFSLRLNLFVSDLFPVNGSEVLHLGMSEDHNDDNGFALLDADSFSQFLGYIEGKGSEAHHAGAEAQSVDHQLHVADIEDAVQFIALPADDHEGVGRVVEQEISSCFLIHPVPVLPDLLEVQELVGDAHGLLVDCRDVELCQGLQGKG